MKYNFYPQVKILGLGKIQNHAPSDYQKCVLDHLTSW
jgi:hypothetical protein